MINEQDFIKKLKAYDNSGLEFDSIDSMNEITKGNIRPFRKRGIADNEYTIIDLSAFDEVNEDLILNLFDVIPPGPKEMERARTHLIVGRYTQAIMLSIILNIDGKDYLVLQERHPVNFGFKKSTELYRDYIKKDTDLKDYIYTEFKDLIKHTNNSDFEVIETGYFWENTGVIGVNVQTAIVRFNIKNTSKDKVLDLINTKEICDTKTIMGDRALILHLLETIRNSYTQIPENGPKHYISDLFSVSGLFMTFRYLDKFDKQKITSIK